MGHNTRALLRGVSENEVSKSLRYVSIHGISWPPRITRFVYDEQFRGIRITLEVNWSNEFVGKSGVAWWKTYGEYLNSPDWRKRREKCLKRDGYECRICGSKFGLQCHHKVYARVGNESPNDLTTLCEPCHKVITSALRRRKKKINRTIFDNVVSVPTLEFTG